MSIKTVTYDSVGDFLAAADSPPEKSHSKVSHIVGQANFHGTDTFREAMSLAAKGWPEGVERLSGLRASLDRVVEKTIDAKTQSLHWDVTGNFLDVGRHLSGEPEAFGEYGDPDSNCQFKSRVIKLVANMSAIGGVCSESIFSAGAAIYAAIDIIETLGHRVELWLGSGSNPRSSLKENLQILVLLKEASQPIDPGRLAFYLCHNASLRRLFFSVEEDLGYSPSFTTTCPLKLDDDSIVTSEVRYDDDTQEKRIERVLEVCKSVGITFTQEELSEITAS